MDSTEFAFCPWYPEGKTLNEAVPTLEKLISIRKEWRAVILADSKTGVLDHRKNNPFDAIDYKRIDKNIRKAEHIKDHRGPDDVSIEEYTESVKELIREYRSYVAESVEKAISNPLMKLSVWLAGSAVRLRPTAPPIEFLAAEPFSDEYESVRAEYGWTVSDMEISLARAHRFDRLSEYFELGGDLFNPPKMVFAVAERSVNTELDKAASLWGKHTDYDYSNFIEDNMYSNKLRCLIYDLPRVKGRIKENDYFNYLTTMMIIAQNDIQSDILKFGKVYDVSPEVNESRMKELCNSYIVKLRMTLKKIAELRYVHKIESARVLDDSQAEKEFEKETKIPVTFSKEYDRQTLLCEYDEIGLSRDCPSEEEEYWTEQHKGIRKRFNRFIRQPQRCVEKAVDLDFRRAAEIDTEKAKRLNKFQKQDVLIKLYDEEQNMLETHTSKIYDKSEYDKKLDKADKAVLQGVSERMTRRRTIIAAVIPAALVLIGFLPLFISELNNLGTISMSMLLTAISVGAVLVCAMIMLIIFKREIVGRFKGFNASMNSIYNQICGSMEQFSEYLSHAGNVMREFAVLNACDDQQKDLTKVYRMHEIEIENNITEIMTLFSDYVDASYIPETRIEPYNYDFDLTVSYCYDMPYKKEMAEIDFLQNGNRITVPVDYIKSVKLKREELYD